MKPLGALLLLAVSYSRDIAPIFALHCNSCHGDSGIDGGLTTGSHASLMEKISPGDPDGSQLVQAIEGARGEAHRMPLGGPPLEPARIAMIRRWIAEGAAADAIEPGKYTLPVSRARIRKGQPLRIECSVPGAAYLVMRLVASGRVLFERRAAAKSPGEPAVWTIWPEKGWPETVDVEVSVLYAGAGARDARLTVK